MRWVKTDIHKLSPPPITRAQTLARSGDIILDLNDLISSNFLKVLFQFLENNHTDI